MTINISDKESVKPKILIVDDEVSILQAIKRLLRKSNISVELANGAEEALVYLKTSPVDLVISDMKMPGMSGAELFTQIAALYPNTYRVLLTGFADIDSTIKAINHGKIHRYVQKPWNNDALLEVINEGLEIAKLKQENVKLQQLLKKQNELLKGLNTNLEKKVQLRTKHINLALSRIEHDHKATQKVLYNLININPNLDGKFANSVSLLAKRLAKLLDLSPQEIHDITFAALISEIGLLGVESALYTQPFNKLKFNQKEDFYEQINVARVILNPAQHLNPVSEILFNQFEKVDGNGVNKLVEEEIPIGSKILAVAKDFWLLRMGRVNGITMTDINVRIEMKKLGGIKYDLTILSLLLDNPNIISNQFVETPIGLHEIEPGMVLKYNLFTQNHMLILPEGHVFTDVTLNKLKHFDESQNTSLKVIVESAEQQS
ncbi:response regulator [Paraglaciecola sp.]|uniref:response regulator n=1 Tax=Paraglaciecola sp. TaxID=1920173 RepID=UPI003EF823E8